MNLSGIQSSGSQGLSQPSFQPTAPDQESVDMFQEELSKQKMPDSQNNPINMNELKENYDTAKARLDDAVKTGDRDQIMQAQIAFNQASYLLNTAAENRLSQW